MYNITEEVYLMDKNINEKDLKIGNYLKKKREELEISQSELAEKIGASRSAISRWESGQLGKMGKTYIEKIAKELHINPTIIVTGDIPEQNKSSYNRIDVIAAHLDSNKLSDDDIDDIQQFIQFVKSRKE